MKRYAKRKRKNANKWGVISITAVVLMMSLVLSIQMYGMHEKNELLNAKKAKLQESLEEQNARMEELEQQRLYVQTNQYIEQKAKELGYIYPGEVIFKPEE